MLTVLFFLYYFNWTNINISLSSSSKLFAHSASFAFAVLIMQCFLLNLPDEKKYFIKVITASLVASSLNLPSEV